ncbi:LysR substrate-binding domain-containing protein [uncultured Paracoccus sp.]|uniref:LysR substrate-binding domain-containing protein n=1 Tax=uncultured Paracoccus sp. TaxID=189685 RepID=UPI00260973C6|nr:LysR substrate-binding domain-containing protein [uncultured Paracoccus sp.]
MDVKSLYTFIAVVDHGSFATAAKALQLSASAVSVQMRGLESDVSLRLFDRSRRPPVVTPEGLDFVQRAREVIAIWEDLSDSLRRDSNSGKLRIGAVHTAVSSILPAALRRLQEAHPNLEMRLTTGLAHDLDAALRAGSIDVALTTAAAELTPGYVFRTISEQRLVVLAHAGAAGDNFRDILRRNPYVRFSRHARVGELVERALLANGIRVQSSMEVDTQDGVLALVAAGLGASVVPEYPGLRTSRFRVEILGDPPTIRRLGLMFDPASPRRRFCDLLESELRAVTADPGLLSQGGLPLSATPQAPRSRPDQNEGRRSPP